MVIRLIDNATAVQNDLFEWGSQTHAPGAVKRVEQRERDREDRREQRRDRYEHVLEAEEFDRELIAAAAEAPQPTGQLILPGMEEIVPPWAPAPGDYRGRRLDLEA